MALPVPRWFSSPHETVVGRKVAPFAKLGIGRSTRLPCRQWAVPSPARLGVEPRYVDACTPMKFPKSRALQPGSHARNLIKEDKLTSISSTATIAAAAVLLGLLTFPGCSTAAMNSPAIDAVGQTLSGVPFSASGSSAYTEGFVSSFLLILFSEIGDKTFFIAVLLALQQSRGVVFAGTFGALAVMTVVSVALGRVFHELDEILPSVGLPLDDLLAAALLIYFGVTTLLESFEDANDGEREEAQEVVATMGGGSSATLMLSTFALVFAAEWGDKSFLATIALAAASSPVGVVSGAIAGHAAATALAVLGGSVLGKYASEKVLKFVGGSLFLVFAAGTLFEISTKL